MGKLENKVAVITGGSIGIGKAICQLFASEGAKVAILDILDKEGNELAIMIREKGFKADYFHADVSNENNIKKVFSEINSSLGTVDILVNNAAIMGENKPLHELSEAEWDQVIDINIKGEFFCMKNVIPGMIEKKTGSIINISSVYGLIGSEHIPQYHASKGAIRMLSKTTAVNYAKYGIRVNSIYPGAIWTKMIQDFINAMPDPEQHKKDIEALHPLGRIGEPEDIAFGALYLASDEAKFVTGAELVIDGGLTAK